MKRAERTARHELGHTVAVIAQYGQPPYSVVVRPDGSGHVRWSFPVQSTWRDAVILASGKAAEVIGTRPIHVESIKSEDFDLIDAMGFDHGLALTVALAIIARNRKLIDEHWPYFAPREGTRYRLIKGKNLKWLADKVR